MTVGVSTTAALGMMAGYGIADQAAADKPVLLPIDETLGATMVPVVPTVPPAAPIATTLPVDTAPPQVIVVVIDGATGRQISGDVDLSTLAASPPDAAIAASSPDATATTNGSAATPAAVPVAAPTAVDLAVPAPTPAAVPAPTPAAVPASTPAAAPAAAPAPPPQPAATSGGS
jgi:hypothetical protein